MECEVCPVAYRCGRGFFKHCPYEVDDTPLGVKDDFVGPLKEVYITSFEDLELEFQGFMEF